MKYCWPNWGGAACRSLPIPEGVSYNSYVLLDEKTVLFDTVDFEFAPYFLDNLDHVLNGRPLDYIIINHWEPDHASTFQEVILRHPEATVISTEKGFYFMTQFNYHCEKRITVGTGDTFSSGKHNFAFVQMPMVHWPEPMATLDTTNGVPGAMPLSRSPFAGSYSLPQPLQTWIPDFVRGSCGTLRFFFSKSCAG